MNSESSYHEKVKRKMHIFVHEVYKVSKKFPCDESYGVTSQLRRSSLSVVLNYIEGYARFSDKSLSHFISISYGSLQESKYLLEFSHKEGYISVDDFEPIYERADELGKILWSIRKSINDNSK